MVSTLCAAAATAADARVPLAYRGCIAAGELAVSGSFFVGEAIDEAATWHEKADAAITWVTPSARASASLDPSIYLMEWPVPLKSGGAVRCLTVNPFWIEPIAGAALEGGDVTTEIDELAERLRVPFASSAEVDVVRKRQLTEDFLSEARSYTLSRIPEEAAAYEQERYENEFGSDGAGKDPNAQPGG